MSKTEEAIRELAHLSHDDEEPGRWDVSWGSTQAQALRHLIAEARKVEKVKAKYATLRPELASENYDVAQAWDEGFHEAWEDVMLILSSPSPETGREKAEAAALEALAHLKAEAMKVPGLVKALSEITRLYHGVEISGEPFAPDDEEWRGAIDAARAALKEAKP